MAVAGVISFFGRVFFCEKLLRGVWDFDFEYPVSFSESSVDFLVVFDIFQDFGCDFLFEPQLTLSHVAS